MYYKVHVLIHMEITVRSISEREWEYVHIYIPYVCIDRDCIGYICTMYYKVHVLIHMEITVRSISEREWEYVHIYIPYVCIDRDCIGRYIWV